MTKSCLIYLIRRGPTALDGQKTLDGLDPSLSEEGGKLIDTVYSEFRSRNFTYVYTSPKARAVQSAVRFSRTKSMTVRVTPRLDLHPKDTMSSIQARVFGWIRSVSIRHRSDRVAAFTHERVMQAIYDGLSEGKSRHDLPEFPPGTVMLLKVIGKKVTLESTVHPDEICLEFS